MPRVRLFDRGRNALSQIAKSRLHIQITDSLVISKVEAIATETGLSYAQIVGQWARGRHPEVRI